MLQTKYVELCYKRNNPMKVLFCSKANSFLNMVSCIIYIQRSGLLGCKANELMNRPIYEYFEVILCSSFEV